METAGLVTFGVDAEPSLCSHCPPDTVGSTLGLESKVHFLSIYRNPLAVAHSLRRREAVNSISHGVAMWKPYNEIMLKRLRLYDFKEPTNIEL